MLTVVEMTSVALSAEQQKLIETISKENGFTDYEVKAISGSAKGDNYLGVITSVTIEDGNNKLELILKSAHVGEIRNQMPIHKAYMREIFVYEQVFAKFKKFQEEYRISEPFQSYPKLYGTCDTESSECLVMENLRESGYKLWNRKLPMNPEHLTAVMKEYAKLHAVSLAMKEKQPEAFKELTKDMGKHTFADDVEDRGKAAAYVSSVMGNIWGAFEHDPVTTEVLKGFEKRLPDMFTELTTLSDEPVVIDHGDCWCNNLLFSYKVRENLSSCMVFYA
ncbi:unnamed protein product [Phaedon cochleariae]|uniref:CHK kinase-like domain-containing protein n=1 Tax=Phaedon cochleariae TaxID=80249 RepID=A0A9N9X7H1_PHACE|nr:unnamed protein product [Phaedon cochleariae]